MTFRDELQHLINRHSAENGSNSPDFILADYLCACLSVFDAHVRARDEWRSGQVLERMTACIEGGPASPSESVSQEKP